MKSFPKKLTPANRNLFKTYKFNRDLCKLRKKILEYMYSEDKGGFDLKCNIQNGTFNYCNVDELLVEKIREELHTLGWKTRLEYGNTTLFIYEREDELPNISDMEQIE